VVLPNLGLFSVGAIALCIGIVISLKDYESKQMKCPKCGTKKMRTRGGQIICNNGHKIIVDR
jgi:PHP family Zn ribbon phosphoesterase